MMLPYHCIGVLLQFSQVLFVGSEDSGMAEVCVQRVGASDLDLDVLVTSRETVSPSAQGIVYIAHCMYCSTV